MRYFETQSGPTSCSFVRLEKVDFGVGLLAALRARYTNERSELGEVGDNELYVPTARNKKVQILLVGQDQVEARQSQIDRLVRARLVGAGVSEVVRA